MSIIVSRLLALVNTLTNVPIILHISRSAALRHIVSPTDRPVATSIRTSANIDPSLIQVTRHEDQETKKTRDEPKAVRAREEIGTVVVQLWLIGEETATGARGRARNPSVKCDIARHEVIRVAYRRERASLDDSTTIRSRRKCTTERIPTKAGWGFCAASERSAGKFRPFNAMR